MACRCQDDFGPWPARGESGPINLVVNCAGARSAGNPLATCDVAGAGNQLTVRIVRHSQRKRGATDRPDLRSNGTSPRPYRGSDTEHNAVAVQRADVRVPLPSPNAAGQRPPGEKTKHRG